MPAALATTITVIDFRRQSLMLEWNSMGGTWTACDVPPAIAHGVALIRAAQPNICVYGHGGALILQVGENRFELQPTFPVIACERGFGSFGLRRRFTVESGQGEVLFDHSYWASEGEFFDWLTARSADPQWRSATATSWSIGVEAAVLRAG